MTVDPLTSFIARSLRAEVSEVSSEVIAQNARLQLERITFRQEGAERSVVMKRVPPEDALEVQLLPLLARKTDRVPIVHARGIPPPAVAAWPWVLTEDLADTASACHGDLAAVVRAKGAVERAVARDEPALRALGVPALAPIGLVERATERAAIDRPIDADARAAASELARLPVVLCHGDLTCANARTSERGVILVEWRRAFLGCGLLDIARFAADAEVFTGKEVGTELFAIYSHASGTPVTERLIRAARRVHAALSRAS